MKLIFNARLHEDVFPDDWEQSHLVPIQQQNKTKKRKKKKKKRKDSKKLMKKYRPTSILPILSKLFEKLVLNFLSNYFMQNKLQNSYFQPNI